MAGTRPKIDVVELMPHDSRRQGDLGTALYREFKEHIDLDRKANRLWNLWSELSAHGGGLETFASIGSATPRLGSFIFVSRQMGDALPARGALSPRTRENSFVAVSGLYRYLERWPEIEQYGFSGHLLNDSIEFANDRIPPPAS